VKQEYQEFIAKVRKDGGRLLPFPCPCAGKKLKRWPHRKALYGTRWQHARIVKGLFQACYGNRGRNYFIRRGISMAKVIITLSDVERGLDVQCRVEPGENDSERLRAVAAAVGYGLAGHVNEKIRNALIKTKKGKSNVH
jgi:hypothetical protein